MNEELVIPKSLHIYNVEVDGTKILGRGSYGTVYEARYYGTRVAVKKLHPIFFDDVSADENIGILKTWRNELQLMSNILHPNIVQFYGVYNSENQNNTKLSGDTFIVSELMHKSLRTRNLETPRLKYSEIINILHDIGAGLCYLHGQPSPIMHRDLASKNILLTISGQAKIADLGVAKITSQKKESLTRHPGTDAYMPVEAIAFENGYDCSIDVYALGVIGLELGISRDPKATQCLKKVGASYVAVAEEERRKIDFADLAQSPNADLKDFIMQCLDKIEVRITAITALDFLEKLKKSVHYELVEETSTYLEKNIAEENTQLKRENSKLKEEIKWLEEEKENRIKENEDKLSSLYCKLKEKDDKLEKLHNELEMLKGQSLPKRHIDSGSSYISRDPPPPDRKHYNYNSSINKPQLSVSSHGSLVIPSAAGRSTLSMQPTFGSQQGRLTKVRPASTIVTGTSHSTNHVFMTQRSHSEDELKYPPPLPGSASSQSGYPTVQNVIQTLTQYHAQINDGFKKLKVANSAVWMGTYIEGLKYIMENFQSYIITIPQRIQIDPEVDRWLTKLDKQIGLLKKVDLDQISFKETDRLSQAARRLQAEL